MVIEAIVRVEALMRECKASRLIMSFEELYHLKDNWSGDTPRKRLRRSAGRIEGKAGKHGFW